MCDKERNDRFQIALTKYQKNEELSLQECIDLATEPIIWMCKHLQMYSDALIENIITKTKCKETIQNDINKIRKELIRIECKLM